MDIHKHTPEDFDNPIQLPVNELQSENWQIENRDFWENNPMRYDWKDKLKDSEFSKDFFVEIDRRFFASAEKYLPFKNIPFDRLIDFGSLKDKDVLEIGVGMGSHAQLLSMASKSLTGIDITANATKGVTERLRIFNLTNSKIIRMDAEKMGFRSDTFDFIWTWGVIHHSANTRNILKEMNRVLKPGGKAITMVYHKSLWNYYILGLFYFGLIRGEMFRSRSLHKIIQKHSDGAIARYYSIKEWKELVSELFCIENIVILGAKEEVIPLPGGKFKNMVMGLVPDRITRFFTNRCKCGSFLVSALRKK